MSTRTHWSGQTGHLREDSCMKFGEWLRCQAYKREVTW